MPEWERNRLFQIRRRLGEEAVFHGDELEWELMSGSLEALEEDLQKAWNRGGRQQKTLRYIYNHGSIDFKQLASTLRENLSRWRNNQLLPEHWRDLPELIPLLLKPECLRQLPQPRGPSRKHGGLGIRGPGLSQLSLFVGRFAHSLVPSRGNHCPARGGAQRLGQKFGLKTTGGLH